MAPRTFINIKNLGNILSWVFPYCIAPEDLALAFAYFVLLLTVRADSEGESSLVGIGVTYIGKPPGGTGVTICGIVP